MLPHSIPPEEWLPIDGYKGRYEVSSYGRVRSMARFIPFANGGGRNVRGQVLMLRLSNHGYYRANLGRDKDSLVHRLVAAAFIGDGVGMPVVNHIDGIKTNNHVSNLEWVSYGDNQRHAYSLGLTIAPASKKTHCPQGHAYDKTDNKGRRHCITCDRARWARYHRAHREKSLAKMRAYYISHKA